ncbi:MAG TPA: DMT family transporter [Firmicutes bacterium]|nr:DMT family transporter [Bacillota bacterium]
MQIFFLLIAGLAGALMAVQGCLNSYLGEKLGLIPATFSVQLLGTVTIGLFFLLFSRKADLFSAVVQVPLYYWLGGPLGVAIIYGVATAIPKVGVGNATTGIIFCQLLTAYLIDHFGIFSQETVPFTGGKGLGLLLMVGGAFLLLRR